MLVLNLPFKALMFLTLMRPSLVLFLVLWLKLVRSEERFSRNAETDLVCRLLLEKKKKRRMAARRICTTTGQTRWSPHEGLHERAAQSRVGGLDTLDTW